LPHGPDSISAAPERRYNPFHMDTLIRILARVLVPMFFVGMAGSALVIVVSLFKDIVEFSQAEDE
jgi:hypothetical protein